MDDMRDVADRQKRDLGAVETATAGRCAGLGARAPHLLLVIVVAGGLVEERGDILRSHVSSAFAATAAGRSIKVLTNKVSNSRAKGYLIVLNVYF